MASTTLALTALSLGLAGVPHCAAMCGAACGGLTREGGTRARWKFQLGRLAGYVLAGAVAAGAGESLAWLAGQAAVLRPLWTVFHLAVLAWALSLLVLARQPAWVVTAGRTAWRQVQPIATRAGGPLAAGMLWIFMPCGLLWSALLVASLSGGPLEGAVAMALFAVPSAAGLWFGPALLARARHAGGRFGPDWGTRAAGALLGVAAAWALWMDLGERIAAYCL